MVASRAWNVGYYGSLVSNYSIEKARLSGVRWARDYDPYTLAQWLRSRKLKPLLQLFC
jgi:hypothetical protein